MHKAIPRVDVRPATAALSVVRPRLAWTVRLRRGDDVVQLHHVRQVIVRLRQL